jgi:ABC-type transport system involved in multi-copper enzyme maturation permease subunit
MRSAWRAELLKITTVRGQWISAILATAAMPLTSLLVAGTGRLDAGDSATAGAATGAVVGLLAFGAWGAVLAASEYSSGTIVVSLATVPRRPVFYTAKLAAAATVAGAAALLSVTISLFGVLAVAPGRHPLGNPAELLSVVFALITVTVAGAAVGIVTRSPSASIAIVVAAVLLPDAAGGLLGRVQPWVVGASPGTVITQFVGGGQLPAGQTYPAGVWAGAATMLLVAGAVVTAGAIALVRRDG